MCVYTYTHLHLCNMYMQYLYNMHTCTQLIVVSNYTQSSMYFLQLFSFSVLCKQVVHLTFSAVDSFPHLWGFLCREAFGVSTGGGGQGRPSRLAAKGAGAWAAAASSRRADLCESPPGPRPQLRAPCLAV